MKRRILILALCLLLGASGLAEASSADDFFANLGKTWDSFVAMTDEAANSVSAWADESGVTAWFDEAGRNLSDWFGGSGLGEWAGQALGGLQTWANDTGLAQWAENVAAETEKLVEQNRPAVESWLNQAGEDVKRAWDTLVNAGQHSQAEVEAALETVTEALETASSPVVGSWRHDEGGGRYTLLTLSADGTGALTHYPEDMGLALSWESAADGWIVHEGSPDVVGLLQYDAARDRILYPAGNADEYVRVAQGE